MITPAEDVQDALLACAGDGRTALHRRFSRLRFGIFFFVFGVIETVLVLSIDGMPYPFQWGDLLSALAIFTLLAMIFMISFVEAGTRDPDDRKRPDDGDGM